MIYYVSFLFGMKFECLGKRNILRNGKWNAAINIDLSIWQVALSKKFPLPSSLVRI